MSTADAIKSIIHKFVIGHLSRSMAERQISAILGGKWVLTNLNDEWIITKFNS